MTTVSCALAPFDVQKAPLKPDQAVIFDIDGTLTPKPMSIYTARKDAANAVRLYADKGYKIIYLSARNVFFQGSILSWLKSNDFPQGSIHVPQSLTYRSDYAAFKRNILELYKLNGWNFVAAYGDSTSDFKAYVGAGIDKSNIYALKRVGQQTCQPGIWAKCVSSWTEQIKVMALLTDP